MIGRALRKSIETSRAQISPEQTQVEQPVVHAVVPAVKDPQQQDEQQLAAARASIVAEKAQKKNPSFGQEVDEPESIGRHLGLDEAQCKQLESLRKQYYTEVKKDSAEQYIQSQKQLAATWINSHRDMFTTAEHALVQLQQQYQLSDTPGIDRIDGLYSCIARLIGNEPTDSVIGDLYHFISNAHALAHRVSQDLASKPFADLYKNIVPVYEYIKDCMIYDEDDIQGKTKAELNEKNIPIAIYPAELLRYVKDDESVTTVQTIGMTSNVPGNLPDRATVKFAPSILELRTRQTPQEFLNHLPITYSSIISPGGQEQYIENFYVLLGLPPTASMAEIKKAIVRGIKMKYHPDNRKDFSPEDESRVGEIFQLLTDAEIILTDPQKRARYDAILQNLGYDLQSTWGGAISRDQYLTNLDRERGHINYSFLTREPVSEPEQSGDSPPDDGSPRHNEPEDEPRPLGEIPRTISAGKTTVGGKQKPNMDAIWVDGEGMSGGVDSMFKVQLKNGTLFDSPTTKAAVQACQEKGYVGAINVVADGTGSVEKSEQKSAAFAIVFPKLVAEKTEEFMQRSSSKKYSDVLKEAVSETTRLLKHNTYLPGKTNFVASIVGPDGHTYVLSIGDANAYTVTQREGDRAIATLVSENKFHYELCTSSQDKLDLAYKDANYKIISSSSDLLDHPQINASMTTTAALYNDNNISITDLNILPGDVRLLLCSDGLHKAIDETQGQFREIRQHNEAALSGPQGESKWQAWKAAQSDIMMHILNDVCNIRADYSLQTMATVATAPSVSNLSRDNVSVVVSQRDRETVELNKFRQFDFMSSRRTPDESYTIHNTPVTLINFRPRIDGSKILIGENVLAVAIVKQLSQKEDPATRADYSLKDMRVKDTSCLIDFPLGLDQLIIADNNNTRSNVIPIAAENINPSNIQTKVHVPIGFQINGNEKLCYLHPVRVREKNQYLIYEYIPGESKQWGKEPKDVHFKPLAVWDGEPGEIMIDGQKVRIGKKGFWSNIVKKVTG